MSWKKEPQEIVNDVKLLGGIISDDLKWHKNTNYLTKKVREVFKKQDEVQGVQGIVNSGIVLL